MKHYMKTALVCMIIIGHFFAYQVYAKPLWDDSASGVTRDFYNKATGREWDKRLGDWLDKNGEAWGEIPFASQIINENKQGQYIELDVTGLVRKWLTGKENQGFFLKGKRGAIKFSSKEDVEFSPILEVTTIEGKKLIKSSYDASVVNSSSSPQGTKTYVETSKNL